MIGKLDFENIVLLVGIPLSLIILFFLIKITRSFGKYLPLLIFVCFFSLELIFKVLTKNYLNDFPHLLYIDEPFIMVYGLLIYLYARNQSEVKLKLRKTDLLLFIPFVLAILSYIPYYILGAGEKITDMKAYGGIHYDITENIWEWNFEIILNAIFLTAALKELQRYNSKIKEQFSYIQKIDLHLTQLLIKVCLGTYIIEFVFVYLTLYGFPYHKALFDAFYLFNYMVLLLIGYDAIVSNRHIAELMEAWVKFSPNVENNDKQVIKYAKSNLSEHSSEEIKKRLAHCMMEQKPYLQPQLRIKDLEKLTGITTHHISQVINESFQQNFFEFVNGYRIKEAMKLLKDPQFENYTYTAIGFEAGFNSKSAFYNAFKRDTGKTPAQFKNY